jgi:hypothetical protein
MKVSVCKIGKILGGDLAISLFERDTIVTAYRRQRRRQKDWRNRSIGMASAHENPN